ncbi:MAG: histidinol dehydrogenase [Pseudomonadota bacterium]
MLRIETTDPGFDAAFSALLERSEESVDGIAERTRRIIADVRKDGDKALDKYTRLLDDADVSGDALFVSDTEIEEGIAACDAEALAALERAASRIEAYHQRQLPADERWDDDAGVTLGWRWTPIDAVGLYVPGGTASYPSSVLMNAIPAKVAGAGRIVIATPAKGGTVNPLVLAAARLAGVADIIKVGGAQAVAALAYGTERIASVDKIVGPGNAYVAEAKRQVFGHVGIDSIAGPSEITVIAEGGFERALVAADLLSQSEHDALSQSIVLTTSDVLTAAVDDTVAEQLADHPRKAIASAAWKNHGAIIRCQSLDEAVDLANRIAPEHLELLVNDPEALLPKVKHAGAVFLGPYTPEAIGDYVGGPSHVLPTSGAARFTSGLSVLDFLKRMSVTGCSWEAFETIGPDAVTLADAEGLPSHAASVTLRLQQGR